MPKNKAKQEPEAKASGIQIETKTVTTIRTTDGQPIRKGDTILLKKGDETIVCNFVGLSGSGYFVTTPFDESGAEVQYRLGSIAACFKISKFEFDNGNKIEIEAQENQKPDADPEENKE